MAIITKANAKTLLGIASANTNYDDQITALIPHVQQEIINYCRNEFTTNEVYVESSGIAFVDGSTAADTITDSNSGFVTAGFAAGDHIVAKGSYRNENRIYELNTVAAGTLTLVTTDSVVAEDMSDEESVRLTLVVFPPELEHIAAELIGYHLNKSFTVGAVDSGGAVTPDENYPAEIERDYNAILKKLNRFRKVYE